MLYRLAGQHVRLGAGAFRAEQRDKGRFSRSLVLAGFLADFRLIAFEVEQIVNGWRNGFPALEPQEDEQDLPP